MHLLIYIALLLVSVMLVGLLVLWRQQSRSNQVVSSRLNAMESRLEAMKNDLSGLCSGALGVDDRVSSNEKRVRALIQRLEEMEAEDQDDDVKTYQRAIQMAQQGSSEEELVNQFQLTTDEAALLIRLYRMES